MRLLPPSSQDHPSLLHEPSFSSSLHGAALDPCLPGPAGPVLAGLLDHVDEVGGVLDLRQLLEVAVDLVVGPGPKYALDKQLENNLGKAS